MNKIIPSFCSNRSDSYEIMSELKVRKLLERHTPYKFEFTRNEDPYSYDLKVAQYDILLNGWSKKTVGFIEVEESPKWHSCKYPDNWSTYSYLARKIYEFDRFSNSFVTTKLKENAYYTIYLKVAHDLSDAHCTVISDIPQGKFCSGKHRDLSIYNDTYIRFPIGSKLVIRGIENCIDFIISFFDNQ